MKVSDYVATFLAEHGVKHVFVVTGGAIAHVIDSVARRSDIAYVCTAGEQGAAMAADAYARVNGLGAAFATTGPGFTNLMTGIANLYYDSVPAIFVTGQVSTFRLKHHAPGVRQLGFQEAPHVEMVKPITKYAVLVDDAKNIRFELEKALYLAREGRPGPVLIDICDDVQRVDVDPAALASFTPPAVEENEGEVGLAVERALALLAKAKRPVIVLGNAIRIARMEAEALKLVRRLQVPVAPTWATMDMFASDDPLNVGSFGVTATRRGNFAVQNADLIFSIGSRLDTHATGTPAGTFARAARKIVVDIDAGELGKFARQGMEIDVPIRADVRTFFRVIERMSNRIEVGNIDPWHRRIRQWRKQYPPCDPSYRRQNNPVNPYVFLQALGAEAAADDLLVTDTGANLIQTFQSFPFKEGQRAFSAFNNTPMGYALPASIGACFARGKRRVLCLIGDGGMQVNMGELGTIAHHKLPIKIFVFNNHSYGIIQQTQDDWLDSHYAASRADTGMPDPDYAKIAKAFGLKTVSIMGHRGMKARVAEALSADGPALINIDISPDQRIVPMLKAGRAIEDAKPLIDREEFLRNMDVPPLPASRTVD